MKALTAAEIRRAERALARIARVAAAANLAFTTKHVPPRGTRLVSARDGLAAAEALAKFDERIAAAVEALAEVTGRLTWSIDDFPVAGGRDNIKIVSHSYKEGSRSIVAPVPPPAQTEPRK